MNLNDKTIMFTINSSRSGGAGKILRFVAETSVNYFQRVYVVSILENGINKTLNGVNYIYLNNSHKIKGFWRFKATIQIRKQISELAPDIVCSFLSDVSVITMIAQYKKKSKFITAERGDPNSIGKIWQLLSKIAYKRSDLCIFQTQGAYDFYNIKGRVKIIPNPFIPSSEIDPYFGKREKTIVSAGRFVEQKGFDILIKAFSYINNLYPDYELYIYGDGPLRKKYKKIIDQLDIEKNVFLPGYKDNLALLIRKAGIFVLPSRFEGIPNVLIEAMSLGIPTISTNCSPGGPAFLTDNGRRGRLISVNSVDELVIAILDLIDNKDFTSAYSKMGLEVRSLLNPEAIKELWVEAFRACLLQ